MIFHFISNTFVLIYHWQKRFLLISWVFELKENGSLLLKWRFTNRSLISLVSKRWKLSLLSDSSFLHIHCRRSRLKRHLSPPALFNSVSSTRVIIVGIQSFLFGKNQIVLTNCYLTGPQRCWISSSTTQIPENGWCWAWDPLIGHVGRWHPWIGILLIWWFFLKDGPMF